MFQLYYDIFDVSWLELHPVFREQINSGVSVCECVCVYASTPKTMLSILFFNILPDDAGFCDCHNTLDRLLQGMDYNDAIILFLDHVCTRRPWSPENKVGSLFLWALCVSVTVSTEHKCSMPIHTALWDLPSVCSYETGVPMARKSWCHL